MSLHQMMKDRLEAVDAIYLRFEAAAASYKTDAACQRGCAFCCKEAGRVDITTLEGWRIVENIERMPSGLKIRTKKDLDKDFKQRERGQVYKCPFLNSEDGCRIYDFRPFSCRRIYSVHPCDRAHPPMLSRKVMEMGDSAIRELQHLDDTGYSGHLSFILHLLRLPRFLDDYLNGEFYPARISIFGKAHDLRINRPLNH
jgi:uncharacterized protein